MDEIARYNIKRWRALAEANALFTRPFLHLTAAEAAEQLDPEGRLIEQGFVIQHVSDSTDMRPDPSAEPGTWDHFVAYVPPWLAIWARYRPDGGWFAQQI